MCLLVVRANKALLLLLLLFGGVWGRPDFCIPFSMQTTPNFKMFMVLRWNISKINQNIELTLIFSNWPFQEMYDQTGLSFWLAPVDLNEKQKTKNDVETKNKCLSHIIMRIKVARSDLWVTILFNFERLEHHHYQSNRKSNVSGVLEKDESFKCGTFHQDLSYHSNGMTPCPILPKTE